MLLSQVFLQSVVIILPVILVSYLVIKNLKQLKREKRNPFDEDELIRHPGQSLLEKLEEVNEDLTADVAGMVACPLMFALAYYLQIDKLQENWWIYAMTVASSLAGTLYFASHAQKTLITLRNYRLGYQGELYVAQKLEHFLTKGYRVFHDVVFKGFNIDHVLVGPTGVYIIETKAKRKRNDDPKGHELRYDGKRLTFSDDSFDVKTLEQAKRNAGTLSKLIENEAKETIPVYPIVTYPGWNIDRVGKGTVHVINPKQLTQAPNAFPNRYLTNDQVEKITMVLNFCASRAKDKS